MKYWQILLLITCSFARAQGVLDQSFTDPNNASTFINDCCPTIAQTFTAGITGTLGGINIDVHSTSSYPLHISISGVTNGQPNNVEFGEVTLGSSSTGLDELITFPQTIDIMVGVQYAILVNYIGGPPPGPGHELGYWWGGFPDPYAGGSNWGFDGSGWVEFATVDNHFRTYVMPIPEPTSTALFFAGALIVTATRKWTSAMRRTKSNEPGDGDRL